MAKILHPTARRYATLTTPYKGPASRFHFDLRAIFAHYGDAEQLNTLLRTYGLPTYRPRNPSLAPASLIACLLELAERMHQPLDLHPFVRQVR